MCVLPTVAAPGHTYPPRQEAVETATGLVHKPLGAGAAREALIGGAADPARAGAALSTHCNWSRCLGKGLQWWLHPLCTTRQWHPASLVASDSSIIFPNCGDSYSLPFGLCLHFQHLFHSLSCSPNPTLKHRALLCISRCTT